MTLFSTWDTADIRSQSVSDGSTIVPDVTGRCLRRALDQKVRNLRKMLSFDEDITTELDKVVCRLMKLALHSSRQRQNPPPARWMQCKLLDLLTLTEKAIGRRKKCFIETFPLSIDKQPDLREQDTRVKELVDKYRHLIQPVEKMTNTNDDNDRTPDPDIEDEFLSTTSNDFTKENDYVVGMSPSLVIARPVFSTEAFVTPKSTPDANPLERTKAWVAEDLKVDPYPKHDLNYESVSSGDTDNNITNLKHKHKKSIKKHKIIKKNIRESVAELPTKTSASKTSCKFNIKREYRKHSKTQITKKVARKRSAYNNMIENPDCEYSSADYDSYVAESRRKVKERQTLNMVATNPIPESLIALCHPDLKAKKGIDSLRVYNNDDDIKVVSIPSCICATVDIQNIDIITQDYEETIALRRTIATDAKVAPEIKTPHNIVNSCDDFDEKICTKHEVSTENVQAQTIFLNDINEPSTSKGIRHNISTDVQCGPDALAAYPLITPATSLVKIPQVFSTGIKINDVGAHSKVQGTDFGTSTHETCCFKTITPGLRTIGIKIKDSDENVCNHTECSTMTVPDCVPQTLTTGHSPMSINDTNLIKPISSTLKMEDMDSGSDFCAPSIASTTKTRTYFMTDLTASNALIEECETINGTPRAESPSKIFRLSCGPLNVHSYKEKRVSEDVVCHGEWQRYKPNANIRKMAINFAKSRSRTNQSVTKKSKEILKEKKVSSKEKVYRKRQEKKEMEVERKKATPIRNFKLRTVSQEENSAEVMKPRVSKSGIKMTNKPKGIPRPIKNNTKVASKHAISANTAKNVKSTFTIKRSGISVNVTPKKEIDIPQKPKKSYIPLYLKRALMKDKLNKSLDSATDALRDSKDTPKIADKIAPLKRSNTDEIKKDLLKFGDDLHLNISYFVYRNDMEDTIKKPDDQASENSKDIKSTSKPLDMPKRSHSTSHSINSSTCSSPNSIATVRAASTRAKVTTKRHSAQPYKINVTNSESDNPSPPRIKKVVKRYKVAKKPETKDIGNKENIPESTKNFVNKDKEKIIKSSFAGRPKSICIAQVESKSPPLTQKAQLISNKSIVKTPSRKDSDEKRRASSASVSKKLKSNTSSIYDFIQNESESFKTLDSSNMVLVLDRQQNYENLTTARNISRKSSAQIAIRSNHNLMDELVPTYLPSSLHSSSITTLDYMRQILEETLYRVLTSDRFSSVVLTSDDDVQKANVGKLRSPRIKTNISLVETSDTNNTLNRTFDSILGGESTFSLNDTRLTVTDLDLLSYKSITSDSKYSEYYLADNEFNTSQEIEQVQTLDKTPVQDIFERKEPHSIQSKPGAFAIQAFSGFSLDAEPRVGDQPDPIALADSETGSMAVEINRQATSEELFVSGRSSGSYGSCVLDDDTVVPNWLFQLISHQQSVDEEPVLGPLADPLDEPNYDVNGNIVEPSLFGVAAGAGDGRGMHSDHSQDSSGRGTSLSSSETSSGLQSEVSTVLIDLSPQMEQLRDPMTSTAGVPMIDHRHSLDRTYEIEGGPGSLTVSGSRDTRRTITGVSDIDADISSIGTDAPDLSDN